MLIIDVYCIDCNFSVLLSVQLSWLRLTVYNLRRSWMGTDWALVRAADGGGLVNDDTRLPSLLSWPDRMMKTQITYK